ncbi:MAG: dihydroxy-acid dehydratase, partial [Alcaligenaceae bacterium]|nr:dihydroxy-acid dehydratase [Alcaligenaceae bacterium]
LVRNGDRIRLSVSAQRLDLLVDEDELARRRAEFDSRARQPLRGYAWLYHKHVLQAEHGCDFDFLRQAGVGGEQAPPGA